MNIGEYTKTVELNNVQSSTYSLEEMLNMSTDLVNIYAENVYELSRRLDSVNESYYDRNMYQSVTEGKSKTKKKGKKLVDKLNKQKDYLKNKLEKKKASDKKDKKKLDDMKDKSKKVKLKESMIELSNYYTKDQIVSNTKLLESLSQKMDKTIIKYESVNYHDKYQKEKFVNETSDIKDNFDNTLADLLNTVKESSEYRLTHGIIEESIDTLKEEDLMYDNIRKDYTKAYMEMVTEANKEVTNGLGITELSNAKYDAVNMKSSVLQWKIHMHENSLINAEKVLEETAYLDEELMEDYLEYQLDNDDDISLFEGANWDLYKDSKKYTKEFKDAMKRFKKANKALDYNGAKSALKDGKAVIDKFEQTMKNFKQDESTEKWGFAAGLFRILAKTLLMALPGHIIGTALKVKGGASLGSSIKTNFIPDVIYGNNKSLLIAGDWVSAIGWLISSVGNIKWSSKMQTAFRDKRNKEIVSKHTENPMNSNFSLIMTDLEKLRKTLDKMEKSLKKPGSVKESSDSWLSFE